ncbi:MAG: hypothetical protein ACJAZ1_003175, partial [Yoonia sp.]
RKASQIARRLGEERAFDRRERADHHY